VCEASIGGAKEKRLRRKGGTVKKVGSLVESSGGGRWVSEKKARSESEA